MNSKARFAVLGARSRGSSMAKLYSQHPQIELVAMADPDPAAFELESNRKGIRNYDAVRKYTDPLKMFEKEKGNLDWVLVASPDTTHHAMIMAALGSGYNVFTEKPMCLNMKDADEICDMAEKTGRRLVVGCELRFSEPAIKFKEILSGGKIGKILHGYCIDSVSGGFTYFLRYYRWKKYSLGILMQKGVHSIDLINFFMDEYPVKVYADGGLNYFGQYPEMSGKYCRDCRKNDTCIYSAIRHGFTEPLEKGALCKDHCVFGTDTDIDDNSILIINYSNGARVSYNEINFTPEYKREFHFVGTEGRASLVMDQTPEIAGRPYSAKSSGTAGAITIAKIGRIPEHIELRSSSGESGHWGGDELMRNEIVNAILSGKKIRPDAHDGRMSTAIICAADESMKKQMPILINEKVF